MIIVQRINPLKDFVPPSNVIVVYHKSGTFNETLICDGLLERSIIPKVASRDLINPTLVRDHAPCHCTDKVKEILARNNIKPVPKRFTNLLQPANVSWMRPLKRAYHQKWQHWLINEEFHTQLQDFIERNHIDMIDDFDESDEISGFGSDDPAYCDINLEELSFSESDSDEE